MKAQITRIYLDTNNRNKGRFSAIQLKQAEKRAAELFGEVIETHTIGDIVQYIVKEGYTILFPELERFIAEKYPQYLDEYTKYIALI